MKKIIATLLAVIPIFVLAQNSTWEKNFGGIGQQFANCVIPTNDGGYITTGYTDTYGGGGYDVYVVKTNPFGRMQWQQVLGGAGEDRGMGIVQNASGEYYVCGYTSSSGAGSFDVYVAKLGGSGNVIWTNTYGGAQADYGKSLVVTASGDIVVTGTTSSFGAGQSDFYLLKINSSGVVQWTKTFGTTGTEDAAAMQLVHDGGFILSGKTNGYSINRGYAVRTNANGDSLWTKSFDIGTLTNASLNGVCELTNQTNFVFCGYGRSFGYGNLVHVKTDLNGAVVYTNYSSVIADGGAGVTSTSDGGYATVGYYSNFGSRINVMKFSAAGSQQWTRYFEYVGSNLYPYSSDAGGIRQTPDNGFIVCGMTNLSNYDALIMKLNQAGEGQTYSRTTPAANGPTSFCVGGSVTLSVPAGYSTYQWMKNGGAVAGATNSSFVPTESNVYACVMTDLDGIYFSNSISVSIIPIPTASISPSGSVNVNCGAAFPALTSTTTGTTRQWYLNGTAITGATAATYTPSAAGTYTVSTTNSCGSATSTATTVTVTNQLPLTPVIYSPCQDMEQTCGYYCYTCTLSTNTNPAGSVTYQWFYNGSNTGYTTSTYPATSPGNYTVTATNACGFVTSAVKTISPGFNWCENDLWVTPSAQGCGTTSVDLESPINSYGPMQWYLNGSPISGATNYFFTATTSGTYSLNYTIHCPVNFYFPYNVWSDPVNVTINPTPQPTISAAGNTSVCSGSVTLNASVAAATYQWKLNGSNINGATQQSYAATASGSYTCTITTASCGTTTSNSINVNIGIPTGSVSPSAASVCSGSSTPFSISSSFTNLSYQWRLNSAPINGATSSSYAASQAGTYDCILTNSCGSFTTSTSTMTINPSPPANVNPSGTVNICTGGSVTLNASTGIGYTYQWRKDAVNISGATTSSYTATSAGSYIVVVTGGGCTTTSSATTVVQFAYPVSAIWNFTPLQFCAPGSVQLNTNTGTGYTYQWYKNNVIITGATTANFTATAAGSYTSVVTNTGGCATTSAPSVVSSNGNVLATITTSRTIPFCVGDSVELYSSVIGTSYQWSKDQVVIPAATSSAYYASIVGLYSLTVTDLSGCIGNASICVTTKTGPTAAISSAGTLLCSGGSVLLSASTASDYLYQWYLNGSSIGGATASTYAATSTGSYYCIVNNECGSATSSTIVLTPGSAPNGVITANGSTNICSGGSVQLTANSATSYQWKLNGASITGATSSSYTATSSGNYTCTETNTCGTITSNAITVTVSPQPTVSISPSNTTYICSGGSVTFTANATNATSYQWKLDGNIINGATNSTYAATATGLVSCSVTNSCATVTSSLVYLSVLTGVPAATISTNPTTFCAGGSLIITANSNATISYQWRLNSSNITGATNYTFTATTGGTYDCVETNACGSATSNAITLTVTPLPTAVITANGSPGICYGNSVQLVANTGSGLSYQWYKDGVLISGATSGSYLATVAANYACNVSNSCGTTTSNNIQVTYVGIYPSANISAGGPTTFCTGASVLLTVNQDTGTTYQWQRNGTPVNGATSFTYSATLGGNYVCTKTNTCGSSTSNNISLTAETAQTPTITASNTTICSGNSQFLYLTTGTGSRQWRLNGINISGAVYANVIVNSAGNYDCVVSNTCGSFTSNVITMTVLSLPTAVITGGGTICQGTTITLSANTGTGLTYQWRKNTTTISGATASTYGATTTGSYDCIVSNPCGSTTSNTITIAAGAVPSTPGNISGQASGVCSSTKTYTISAVAGATGYNWTVPAGATLIGGQNTTGINVSFTNNFTSGNIAVVANNGCGSSAASSVTVSGAPSQPGSVIGPVSVCHNQNNVNYSILAVAGAASYTWTVPPGTLIKNGQGTTQIKVRFGNVGGNITVTAINACGNSIVRTVAIAMPCREAGDEENLFEVSVFPNPSPNQFTLDVNSESSSFYSLIVSDLSGRVIETHEHLPVGTHFEFGNNLTTGFYIAEIIAGDERKVLRIVKDR